MSLPSSTGHFSYSSMAYRVYSFIHPICLDQQLNIAQTVPLIKAPVDQCLQFHAVDVLSLGGGS